MKPTATPKPSLSCTACVPGAADDAAEAGEARPTPITVATATLSSPPDTRPTIDLVLPMTYPSPWTYAGVIAMDSNDAGRTRWANPIILSKDADFSYTIGFLIRLFETPQSFDDIISFHSRPSRFFGVFCHNILDLFCFVNIESKTHCFLSQL